jgi:hypothetical protein
MCWQCENPGTTWQDYVEHLRDVLERHCWVVQGVQRERQRPAYAYTIGLAAHGCPELAVTGLGGQPVLGARVALSRPADRADRA